MKLEKPEFWEKDGIKSKLLTPISKIYASQTAKEVSKNPYKAKIPVICVGNLVVGGAGKTPTVLAIAKLFEKKKIHFLSRGYGGAENLPAKVESADTGKYGDEPVLLSKIAPTWVGRDRSLTAKKAEKEGAKLLIMDDGFQNGTLQKDFSIIVIDGEYGFGNGKVIPAGPLREPIAEGLKRADAVLIIGEKTTKLPSFDIPVFYAKPKLIFDDYLKNEDIVAFCGIARPEKFFSSLRIEGLNLVEELSFPDHHDYSEADLRAVFNIASENKAVTVTTEKDAVKITDEKLKMLIKIIKLELEIDKPEELKKLITTKIKK